MKISIIQKSEGVSYAARELVKFLTEFTSAKILHGEGGDRAVTLEVDASMPAHAYSVMGDGATLTIRGGNASSVNCGVYEALADAGILFEATGYSVPHAFDPAALFAVRKEVAPKFRLRGIRQHINFPMDISSYPLKDAQEYIRAISRMRYNAITFHTYPGQWHETRPDDETDHAGHFFYGQAHPLPKDDPLLCSRIHNQGVYCIPEAEAIFYDEAKRADYARYWLNQVMATAKEAGLTITLSVEILNDDEAATVRMLRVLCKTYPLIDTLELITVECGGFYDEPGVTRENVRDFIVGLFGEDILDADGNLPGLPDELPHQLGSSAVSLKRLLRALELRDRWLTGLERVPALRAGLYLTCPDTLRVLRPILRRKRPAETTMSLLPAHGALAVARNIEETGNTSEDWQNTMYYSWAEFDGNMFLQQMSTDGIEKLVGLPDTDSSYGFCINHWRTAENSLTISHAAEAAITAMSADTFYRRHAAMIGIGDTDGFASACRRLAALDNYNRDNLFNIGFCAIGCWLNWHRRNGAVQPRCFPAESLEYAIAEYSALIDMWKSLLSTADKRRALLSCDFLSTVVRRVFCTSVR